MNFATRGTEDLYNGVRSSAVRNMLPNTLQKTAAEHLDHIANARDLTQFQRLHGNHCEVMKGGPTAVNAHKRKILH